MSAFDAYATEYDSHFTETHIGRAQRSQVWRVLRPLLSASSRVLELNCGTGADAVQIAPFVRSVLATDSSKGMIEVASAKTSLPNTDFKCTPIESLDAELREKDLVFSNFGGLNCLSPHELKLFAKKCAGTTDRKTRLLFVVMGRRCVWERLYFKLKGNGRSAARRMSTDAVKVKIKDEIVHTWYYSPAELLSLFDGFTVERCGPVGLFVPPSYLEPFFARHLILFRMMKMLDRIFSKKILADYADHYFVQLIRE